VSFTFGSEMHTWRWQTYISETCQAHLILIAIVFSFYKCCIWQRSLFIVYRDCPVVNWSMLQWYCDMWRLFFLICLWQYIESVKLVIMFKFIFLIFAQDQIHMWFSAWYPTVSTFSVQDFTRHHSWVIVLCIQV
jgi:hypothetical protein